VATTTLGFVVAHFVEYVSILVTGASFFVMAESHLVCVTFNVSEVTPLHVTMISYVIPAVALATTSTYPSIWYTYVPITSFVCVRVI